MAKAKAKKGLSAKFAKGLNKKKIKQKGTGKVLFIKKGSTVPVQFLQTPEDFIEYEVHSWQEGGDWIYVPCTGKGCPQCGDEEEKYNKKAYRMATNIYNLENKQVQILQGPKDLAGRILYRYERKPASFLKRVFDVTKFDGNPVTYQFELAEEKPASTKGLKLHDLEKYLEEELVRFYGDDVPSPEDLEDDDDDTEEEEDNGEDEDEDEDDDDTEDDDDDEDDDDEDDDEDDDDDDDDDFDDDDDEDEDDDDDEDEEEEEKPKRGRPKKTTTSKKPATKKKAATTKKSTTKKGGKKRK